MENKVSRIETEEDLISFAGWLRETEYLPNNPIDIHNDELYFSIRDNSFCGMIPPITYISYDIEFRLYPKDL